MDAVEPLQEDRALLVHVLSVFAVTAAVRKLMAEIQPLRFHQHLETLPRLKKHGSKSGNDRICFLMALISLNPAAKKRPRTEMQTKKVKTVPSVLRGFSLRICCMYNSLDEHCPVFINHSSMVGYDQVQFYSIWRRLSTEARIRLGFFKTRPSIYIALYHKP